MVVAEAAGTLLDIRFKMKDGVAVFGVAGAGDLGEVLDDDIPVAQGEDGEEIVFEAAVEGGVSGEEAAVEQRDREFEVGGIDLVAFLEGARGGAGAEAGVPHGLGYGAEGLMKSRSTESLAQR